MSARDLTALVHLAGFMTGIILYAMLGVMTRRRLAYVVSPRDRRLDERVPLVAAVLGIIWNTGAMFVFAVRDFEMGSPNPWLTALTYTALGFLPAVVVHSTLHRSRPGEKRGLLVVAYAGSGIAAAMQFWGAARGETPSSLALLLLTITYATLLATLAITERRRPGFQRSMTAVALAAFAVSALHLSRHTGSAEQDPWLVELIGHHASLPLVLAILYQDYRFAFTDLFLKRALSLLVLVGVVSLLYATVAAPLVDSHEIAVAAGVGEPHLFTTGALMALWIVTALSYPFFQRRVYRFVDRVILRRADYRELRAQLAREVGASRTTDQALALTCRMLGRTFGTAQVSWLPSIAARTLAHPTITVDARRTEACITIPTAIEPSFEIRLGDFAGGRVLLSDDLILLDAMAALVGRRIDEIRLEAERMAGERREQEMRRLATEAELRALRAQLNPHFLFNALNTLGHLMQAAPDRALTTLYQLTGLLRAVLRKTNGSFVALREELDIVELYLAIEHERFQERLAVTIDVPAELRHARIPPLLLQPLVENAVKHGIAPMRQGGSITVRARRDLENDEDGFLRLTVIDTGAGFSAAVDRSHRERDGVGLTNIERRLEHYYGVAAAMHIQSAPANGTTIEIVVPWIAAEPNALPRPA
jgi:signal transduction histidine kinase